MQITRLVIDDKEYNGFPLVGESSPPPPPPVSTWPRPARIKHYHERWKHRTTGEGLSYIAYKMHYEGWGWAAGDPAAVPFVQQAGVKPVRITPQMEWFIYGLLVESANGALTENQLEAAYRNLLRDDKCYNNKTGWNNGYQSVVLGENLGSEMMRMTGVICTGAMVKVLGPEERIAGKTVYPVLALNNMDATSYQAKYQSDIFTIHAATNSVTAPKADPYHPGKVDPWPILGDAHKSTPFPIFGQGVNKVYIEKDWIELLPHETNARLNPYYLSNYGEVDY